MDLKNKYLVKIRAHPGQHPIESNGCNTQFLNKYLAKNFSHHLKKLTVKWNRSGLSPTVGICEKFLHNRSVHRNKMQQNKQATSHRLKPLGGTAPNSLHSWNICTDINFLSFGRNSRSSCIIPSLHGLLANDTMDLSKNFGKGAIDVSCFKSRSFHEEEGLPLSKGFPILSWDCHKVTKIWFIANEHDHNVWIGVISQLP